MLFLPKMLFPAAHNRGALLPCCVDNQTNIQNLGNKIDVGGARCSTKIIIEKARVESIWVNVVARALLAGLLLA